MHKVWLLAIVMFFQVGYSNPLIQKQDFSDLYNYDGITINKASRSELLSLINRVNEKFQESHGQDVADPLTADVVTHAIGGLVLSPGNSSKTSPSILVYTDPRYHRIIIIDNFNKITKRGHSSTRRVPYGNFDT